MTILDLDASTLAKKIKMREVSSVEATRAYIDQIRKVNPKLNCVVEDRFSSAVKEAERCDQAILDGSAKGRLFGVPISLKEAFDVAGMKTTGGLLHLKRRRADTDAEVVARLRAEGAIVLGKTNTPTLCFCQETDNKLYGRTNNPWDLNRTVGGSSGGEGALIAVGGAAVGVGSDIGGSIRFPSHFTGVVGFKSGRGQVSQIGHFPYMENPLQARMQGIGAIAKSVQDARLIHEIIAKCRPANVDISVSKIVIPPMHPEYSVDRETEGIVGEVKDFLAEMFEIERKIPPLFNHAALLWQLIMSIDGARSIASLAFPGKRAFPAYEYVKEKLFGSSSLHSYLTWAIMGAKLYAPSPEQVEGIRTELSRGDQLIDEYLKNRLLVVPVYHTKAPFHGEVFRELFSLRKTFLTYLPFIAYANTWGLPSLTVPVAADRAGLPIGIQIIGRCGHEDAIFQLGEIIENQFRGYVRCRNFD